VAGFLIRLTGYLNVSLRSHNKINRSLDENNESVGRGPLDLISDWELISEAG
jgi:hypothetical protein